MTSDLLFPFLKDYYLIAGKKERTKHGLWAHKVQHGVLNMCVPVDGNNT